MSSVGLEGTAIQLCTLEPSHRGLLDSATMGILGALAGGSLGFVLGGPLGAILGASLGARVGDSTGVLDPGRSPQVDPRQAQAAFVVALSSLAAKVAKVDGRVTKDEVAAYDRFLMQDLRLGTGERKFAARIFNEARESPTPASEFAMQLGLIFRNQSDRLMDVVTILLSIASADGRLDEAEQDLIRSIARDMGLSAAEFQSCRSTFLATKHVPEASPYEVLGLTQSASEQELRKAHRGLVREYHPDVLQSKGLPEEFLEFANQKLVAINHAWAQIKSERGF